MKNKYKEIDLALITKVFTKKFHFIIIGAVIFGAIGLVSGYVYANYIAPPLSLAEAQSFEIFDLSDISKDIEYYYSVEDEMLTTLDNFEIYVDKVVYNQDYEQLEDLSSFKDQLSEFIKVDFDEFSHYIDVNYTVLPDMIEGAELYLIDEISDAEIGILSSQASVEFLSSIRTEIPSIQSSTEYTEFYSQYNYAWKETPLTSEEEKLLPPPFSVYNEQLYNAALLPVHVEALATGQKHLNSLNTTTPDTMRSYSDSADAYIDSLTAELEAMVGAFNIIMTDIARHNNLIIVHGLGVGQDVAPEDFGVNITHTFIQPDKTDDILAFTTFFALVGICLGFLSGVVRVAKIDDEGEEDPKQ